MVFNRAAMPIAFLPLLGKILVLLSDLNQGISKVISILCRNSRGVES